MEPIGGGSDELPEDRRGQANVDDSAGDEAQQPSNDPRDLRGSQRSGRSAKEDESNREGGPPARGTSAHENRIDPSAVQSRVEK